MRYVCALGEDYLCIGPKLQHLIRAPYQGYPTGESYPDLSSYPVLISQRTLSSTLSNEKINIRGTWQAEAMQEAGLCPTHTSRRIWPGCARA